MSEDDESYYEEDDDSDVSSCDVSTIDPEDFDSEDEEMLRRLGLEKYIKTLSNEEKSSDSEELSS